MRTYRTYYELLGVDRDASSADIRSAYLNLAKRTHPDMGGTPALFEAINEAYDTLRNDESRRAYDLALVEGEASEVQIDFPEQERRRTGAPGQWLKFLSAASEFVLAIWEQDRKVPNVVSQVLPFAAALLEERHCTVIERSEDGRTIIDRHNWVVVDQAPPAGGEPGVVRLTVAKRRGW